VGAKSSRVARMTIDFVISRMRFDFFSVPLSPVRLDSALLCLFLFSSFFSLMVSRGCRRVLTPVEERCKEPTGAFAPSSRPPAQAIQTLTEASLVEQESGMLCPYTGFAGTRVRPAGGKVAFTHQAHDAAVRPVRCLLGDASATTG